MTTTFLASDSEQSFLWELDQSREFVLRAEAKGGPLNRVVTDTRAKVGFLETFVESLDDAANDATRVKPEFRPHVGQLLADSQALYPMARVPIVGFC